MTLSYGFVVGHFAELVGDRGPSDPDRFPDEVPTTGTVTFKPTPSTITDFDPATGFGTLYTPRSIVANLDASGHLEDANSLQGVWLIAGIEYTATLSFMSMTAKFVLTTAQDLEHPLDLIKQFGLTPDPSTKFVVNEQVYADTLAAAARAEAAAAAAEGAAGGGAVTSVNTRTGAVVLTKADVGLSAVDNTADTAKPVSTAQADAIALKAPLASPTFTGTVSGVTKGMVGLGNADNTADAAKPVSTAQQSALDLKAPLVSPTFTGTVAGITKSMVGLGSADNTADADKPISTATATALAGKAATVHTHTASQISDASDEGRGILTTAGYGTIRTNLLAAPWSGQRILAGAGMAGGGDLTTDRTLALSTASLASLANADTAVQPAALATKADLVGGVVPTSQIALGKADVGLGNVDNTPDASKPVSTAQQAALDAKAPLASPTFTGTVSGITKSMVGLSAVDNTADTAKPVSTAQASALALKAPLASPTFTGTVSGITKSMVGLANVDNTADTAKPVSTAQASALALKADLTSPALTGTPTAPTATAGTATTQVATTAFATTAAASAASGKANTASPTFTGTVSGITSAMVGAVANDGNILRVLKITSAAYAALATKDANTLYVQVG